MGLQLQPITLKEAQAFIQRNHRHHGAPVGWLFGTAVNDGQCVVGVVIIGRPVARMLQDGYTAEVTRLCVLEGHPNACSMLYGASWRAARALGYRRMITYTMANEAGSSLKAAGWRELYVTKGGSWDRPSRHRIDTAPTDQKRLWEAV
jgi:hypothetical protein